MQELDPPQTTPTLDLLGAVVVYADAVDDGDPPACLGRAYVLREEDALFLGRSKTAVTRVETEEGSVIHVTRHHLYPTGNATQRPDASYSTISGKHAVIQMTRGGTSLITDLSTNGIWDARTEKHWSLQGLRSQTHVVQGDQTLYLGMSALDPAQSDEKSMFRVQIVRFDAPPSGYGGDSS